MKPTPTAERRHFTAAELRIKPENAPPGSIGTLSGYALKYNSLSQDLGGFVEVLRPGCFAESLKTADVRCLIDHNSERLIGRTGSKTLRLADDATGLAFDDDLPDVTYARDLKIVVDRRDKDGMSFGFLCDEAEWSIWPGDPTGETYLRTIVRARLIEISCVTFPAYLDTSAAIRSRDLFIAGRSAAPAAIRDPRPHLILLDLAARSGR